MSLFGSLFSRTPSVDAATARQLLDEGAVLVDVRTSGEWNAGHAPWATHLPLSELPARQQRLPKSKTIVVVCRSGNRSRSATRHLTASGFDAHNLSGGMAAWARAGLPVVDRAGRPGSVR